MAKILVVDDSSFMRLTLKHLITQCGHQVIGEAENANDALQKYKQLHPDLVTMDIIMPVETGLEAIKQIMAFDPKSKIIVVSAMGQETVLDDAKKNGAKGFLVKPVQLANLTNAIKEALA